MRIVKKIFYKLYKLGQYWEFEKVKYKTEYIMFVFSNKSTIFYNGPINKKIKKLFIKFNGIGGNISDSPHFLDEFRKDYNIIYLDLPGFGMSFNKNSNNQKNYSKDFWNKLMLILKDQNINNFHIISNCFGSNLIINSLYNILINARKNNNVDIILKLKKMINHIFILTPTEKKLIKFRRRLLFLSYFMMLFKSIPSLRKILLSLFEYKKYPLLNFHSLKNKKIQIINKRFYTLPFTLDPLMDVAVANSAVNFYNSLKMQFSEKSIQKKILFLEQYFKMRTFYFLGDGLLKNNFEKNLIIKYEIEPDIFHFTFNRDGIFFKEKIIDKLK